MLTELYSERWETEALHDRYPLWLATELFIAELSRLTGRSNSSIREGVIEAVDTTLKSGSEQELR